MDDLRYPVGRFIRPAEYTPELRQQWIAEIEQTPARLRAAVAGLTAEQLDTPYREGGWTVRQVVHHLFDSHVNSFIRFKLALTEEEPTVKPYDEGAWADLPDSTQVSPEVSLALLEGLHARWVTLLKAMSPADFQRKLIHPINGLQALDVMVGLYAWHGRHHVAHITSLRERMGWA